MSKRIKTHRIDIKVVRTIFTHLDEEWLVRSLEERDYPMWLSASIVRRPARFSIMVGVGVATVEGLLRHQIPSAVLQPEGLQGARTG